MNYLDKLSKQQAYSLGKNEKNKIFFKEINNLTRHHYSHCKLYRKIIKNLNFKVSKNKEIQDLPMLPVSIFKNFDLKSVSDNKVFRKLVSSGTSGKKLSKIYLDKKNAKNQTIALKSIMSTTLGKQRLPMLIVDQNPNILDRSIFNARAAAIYGFSLFGKDYCYLLNKKNEIDYNLLNRFLKKYSKEKFLIFGFTSLIFENLVKKISNRFTKFKFNNAILLHGGGWKKLEEMKVSNELFKRKLFKKLKIKNVFNYYGLVEQIGSIFVECTCGNFITSNFSDVLIRDKNFNISQNGKKGLIQLISLLPTSYPGHNILTEDIGEIVDKNNLKCGIKGKHFKVHGRAKEAEIRGCSDAR